MKVTILTDDASSWFVPFGQRLKDELTGLNHEAQYIHTAEDMVQSNVCFLLSCTRIVPKEKLELNERNIVIHASDLPQGKGFSPLQWQILEGKDSITLTLFEAVDEVDAGPYYFKDSIELKATELYDELRLKLGNKIVEMAVRLVRNLDELKPKEQTGAESFYPRRRDKDDELDITRSIESQFNHFRIADNEKYPLWFEYKGQKYTLKIEKKD